MPRSLTARRIHDLLAAVPADEPRKIELAARARSLSRDCGCAMGGAFLGVALILTLVYVAMARPSIQTALAGALFVLVATVLGKLTGLVLASIRLVALHRSLSRELQRAA